MNENQRATFKQGVHRTDMYCTDCSKLFYAKVNHDISGNHKINCPHCGHIHWRVIKDGCVTEDRWGSQNGPNVDVSTQRMWSDSTLNISTTSAAELIRKHWFGDKWPQI